MALGTSIEQHVDDQSSPGSRIGKVRWTICAMLFVATSINYMDRQVISVSYTHLNQFETPLFYS